ncbi:Transcription factor, fungi [Penicillium expansum]|nr:Transcription factor, fungi [Penicillium expansum]
MLAVRGVFATMAGSNPRSTNAQVKHLLEKVRTYEEQLSAQSAGGPVSSLPSPVAPDETLGRQSAQRSSSTPGNNELPNQRQDELLYPDNDPAISPATDLTSGPAFESQVRSLLDSSHSNDRSFHGSTSNFQYRADRLPQWTSVKELVDNVSGVSFPSLEESQHLLDQFLFYLGVSQHFFDPRSFSDDLMLLFQSPETRQQQMNSPWFTEYLLVMAMAKLMDVKHPTSQTPGTDLFAEALKRLPPLHHMGGEGVIAVEILTLITTYLQWCDRKHDAYLYIGLALRLAIALGCNLREIDQRCLPSQSAHRLRLWWTVYMLDRRLSSGLGLAAGADERQLRTELPRNAMGFQSPIALSINVRIARVTDDIMSSRYGFFDLDATFSAAFVLVMVGFLDKSQSQPPPALDQASKVLQFLSRSGNLAAERRLQDIAQSYLHVWPDHVFDANASHSDVGSRDKTQTFAASPDSRQDALLTSLDAHPYMAMASSSRSDHQDEIRLLEPWSNMDVPDAMFDMQGDWNLDLSGEAEGIYSSFHNPTLPLTGVDYIDWLEIEKVFNGPLSG